LLVFYFLYRLTNYSLFFHLPTQLGHASKGCGNTRINNEIYDSLSRKRITVSLRYAPGEKQDK
jgi:hypothetical protein